MNSVLKLTALLFCLGFAGSLTPKPKCKKNVCHHAGQKHKKPVKKHAKARPENVPTAKAEAEEEKKQELSLTIAVLDITHAEDTWPLLMQLRELAQADEIQGVIIRLNNNNDLSLGESYSLFSEVKRVNEVKPVIGFIEETCELNCYYVALGAEAIIASPVSTIGGIGFSVTLQRYQNVRLDNSEMEANVEYTLIAKGKYKTAGNPHSELSDDHKAYFDQLIQDYYDQFCEDIAENRNISLAERDSWADGKEFSGRRAVQPEIGLVDEVGSLSTVVKTMRDVLKERNNRVYGKVIFFEVRKDEQQNSEAKS